MRISLNKQLTNHQIIVKRLVALRGNNGSLVADYLNKCIYSVGMGSNDYINNYFMPKLYQTSRLYTPQQYADVLVQEYSQQLRVSIQLQFHYHSSSTVKLTKLSPMMIDSVQFWGKEDRHFWSRYDRLNTLRSSNVWLKRHSVC